MYKAIYFVLSRRGQVTKIFLLPPPFFHSEGRYTSLCCELMKNGKSPK